MSNVPIFTTRDAKRLDCNPHVGHAPPTPLIVWKGANGVQNADFEAIDIADSVVHVHPGAVLEPVIQSCTGRLS